MMRRLRHRGPDGEGLWRTKLVSLGHTRLKVIDLTEAGHQPMLSRDGRFVLVYNGEVYNYRELRGPLRDRGHAFSSDTDTEVVLNAWVEWGSGAVDRLEGMYAFAVWDSSRHRLHVVRDRVGIKPLYWYDDGAGTFIFASEVRALLASGLVERVLDERALLAFLSQQTVPTPHTLIEGIRMLPPGCCMRVDLHSAGAAPPVVRRYWNPLERARELRDELRRLGPGGAAARVRGGLLDAVERRLISDVPLGAFLSGGVDSTVMVGLMSRVSNDPIRTFAVAFEEPGFNDGPYARVAAERFHTEHTEVRITDEELVASVPDAVAAQDHPSADGINTWIVSRAARAAGLTVALSGLGADELFGGYPTFRRLATLARVRTVLQALPAPACRALGSVLASARHGVTTNKIAALLGTDGSVAEAYPILREVFGAEQISGLVMCRDGQLVSPAHIRYSDNLRRAFREHPDLPLLARVSYAEMTSYMRDVLLRDVDQMSMIHALEVRVPFLDSKLVQDSLALPEAARRPSSPPKRFILDAFADLLPPSIAGRPKHGFVMPFDRWMRGPLRSFCEDGVAFAAAHSSLSRPRVWEVWRAFLEGDPRMPWSRPWLLVALGHWFQREEIQAAA